MKRYFLSIAPMVVLASGLLLSWTTLIAAEQKYEVKPLAQKKVAQLPAGPLYWRVETFPTLIEARAAVGPDGWDPAAVHYDTKTALIAEAANKVWVVTLGPQGVSTPGGTKLAEIGPVSTVSAPEYLLRLNYGSGPAGSKTPAHSHPGSESFYVISGRLGQRTPNSVNFVDAGQTMNGHAANTTMQVFNAGKTDLSALIMFVVDAQKPFSVPAKFE